MGQTALTGNFLTKRRVIQNVLELDPGEPFSLKKFLRSQRDIRDIEAFDSVVITSYSIHYTKLYDVFFRLTGMLPLISFFGNHYNRLETWIYMRKDVYIV